MDVEEEILDPYRGVCCAIVGFNIYRFKALWKFVLQYFISKSQGVSSPSVPGYIMTQFIRVLFAVFGPAARVHCAAVFF